MKTKIKLTVIALAWSTILFVSYAATIHAQTDATGNRRATKKSAAPEVTGINPAVTGTGTIGQITKWTTLNSIGDSVISEDKFGKVGIGTAAPTSKLTVQGMIETTLGGVKFPDGTVQTSAAAAGTQSIFHNSTLTGDGSQGSPLGVAVPLTLSGPSSAHPILNVVNTSTDSGTAMAATGGNSVSTSGGSGLVSKGGLYNGPFNGAGGSGVISYGGNSINGPAGTGLSGYGGIGFALNSNVGASGVEGYGGSPAASGFGGIGVFAQGGAGNGAGKKSGSGLYARGGVGTGGATDGLAAEFAGDVEVNGAFNVIGGGTKNFKIDHPLDPENKYLYHAAIESSEVLNIYSGNITTDENGEATVTLPDWFEAVNRDFRYQLTAVGTFAQAIVGAEIKKNKFTIKTNAPGVKVSWQVTGIRSDAAIRKHPFKVEEDKPQAERGSYLAPEAYDQPEERGVEWARNPRAIGQLKQQRKTVDR